ncbi:TrkH family potassium uptake protein [Pseudoflavonifractor sp. MSJ-37]|uniref:TrkH family potassium uptake protein n=1 Tax=Pseudoflavonifractor sp. MSJ-37 TaxID=2841531 RepID=UPI001C104B66|nr:TrkH family potassium uptake protein [Pseudoflavonifractor sp. MSJ-37]MBU5434464.1 TrkH family potassium uptake protein [Pseudoflavonifractor sp. MSJ-37]
MNGPAITFIIGWVLRLEAALMVPSWLVSHIYREQEGWVFGVAMAVCLLLSIPLIAAGKKRKLFQTREGLAAVALSWIALSVCGAIPFVLSGAIPDPVDALFETVSGFTTTGASILPSVERLPRCILFWRSFTHWIGGMGVLVFLLSVIRLAGGSHMNLMKAESPGPSVGKLTPKVQSTAKILYGIYIALTLLEVLFLLAGGMSMFDSLATSLGTAGTGGFGIRDDSMASYSPYLQNVVTVFMILFGINFNVYFFLLCKKVKQALRIEELWWYLGVIAASVAAISWNVRGFYHTAGETVRHAAFQVATVITTSGFSTVDFDLWPSLSKTILVLLMFIGACAGSTGGGIKVSRLLILWKSVRLECRRYLHPQEVRTLRMDGHGVDGEVVRSTHMYMAVYLLLFAVSVLAISLDGKDLITNFTAVAATFNNIGPGLSLVGPVHNFGFFSPFAKLVLIFDMLAGRLELFPMLMLFLPQTWKRF